MPSIETRYFGHLPYENDSIIEFPDGLPGFEDEHRFVAVELTAHRPLVFLQSLATPSLCFPALPVLVVDRHYRLRLEPGDLEALGFSASARPAIGREVFCLAILSIEAGGTTANLLAPVVVNLATRRAVQAIVAGSGYSHRHPLAAQEVPACS